MPASPPMTIDHVLTGPRAPRPSESATATARHVCAAGAGKLVRPERARVGHEEPERQHGDERAHEDPRELGDELLARIRAEEIAALQIGEQIGAAARRRRRHVGAHQVHADVPRVQDTEDELRDLAHRAHRRGIGLAGDPARDERQREREQHRHRGLPVRHAEGAMAEPREPHEADELPRDEPRGGRLDGGDRIIGAPPARAEHRPEIAEGAQRRAPLQRERRAGSR